VEGAGLLEGYFLKGLCRYKCPEKVAPGLGQGFTHLEQLTRDQAQREIFAYIEVFYNRERIYTVLGNLSPLEFKRQTHPAQPMMLEAA